MHLEFRRFEKNYYSEYVTWFADPELDRRLGPMDQAWLDAVLAEPEAAGITWAVFCDAELVAVVETGFDPEGQALAIIMAIAVKPALRHQGLGATVLQKLLALHHEQGIDKHIAYVAQDNAPARRLIERVGFVITSSEPDEHGYLEFRRSYASKVKSDQS